MKNDAPPQFKLETGSTFNGLSSHEYEQLLQSLTTDCSLQPAAIVEAAGVSAAMVLRVALGLSASGATLSAFVDDCRAGRIALAMLRQLSNAGSEVLIFTPGTFSQEDSFGRDLHAAFSAGASLFSLKDTPLNECVTTIENSHAFIFGTHNGSTLIPETLSQLCNAINELQTPVHAIEFPPGINPLDGSPEAIPVFAATTIVAGMPLDALAAAHEFAGRMYVCDISVPRSKYVELAPGLTNCFVGQPVNQIFINKAE